MNRAAPQLSFASAINEAFHVAMEMDHKVLCYGLGVTDPKGVFGTTTGLEQAFGPKRVFDVPTSENAFTGVGIGASMTGMIPVMTHQRLDFFLLAMDQLVNAAAKWHYMFGKQMSVPITIRLIMGRGWGQGPTHSQNLQSWFAHIPGLKVIMPATAYDAKGMLLASIFDPNPVVFLEHRWLHNSLGNVPNGDYRVTLGSSQILRKGKDVTVVAMSYLNMEALRAADYLFEQHGIDVEIIDARSIKPFDWKTLYTSVSKTGRLLALDTGFTSYSVSSEIVSRVASSHFKLLKAAPMKLGMPDVPEPTSYALTKGFYVRSKDIAESVLGIMGIEDRKLEAALPEPEPHDVPGDWFKGPF